MKKKTAWSIFFFLVLGGCGLVAIIFVGGFAINYYTTIPEECNMEDNSARYGPIKVGTEVILGRHRPVNKTGKWVVVMSKWSEKDKTIQDYTTSSDFPEEYIKEKIDDGYYIYLIDYANGKWIVAMNKTNGFSAKQVWVTSDDFPDNDYIEDKWNDGLDITDVDYGNGIWAIVMSDWLDYSGQSFHYNKNFPDDYLYDEEKKKYFITDLEYGMSNWVTLTSKGDNYRSQSWISSSEFPDDFIEKQRNEGYFIFDIEKKEGMWEVFMTRGFGQIDQVWFTSSEFPTGEIEEKWSDSYYLTNVSYGYIGQDHWTYEKNNYVGLKATATELAGVDSQGCPIIKVNVDRENWGWRIRDLTIASNDSRTPKFKPSAYEKNSGTAFPGSDTSISLEDGTALTILGNSIEETVNVHIERNPSKVNSLPELGDDVVQISDFYNFEVAGTLMGPVEITMPYDKRLIPNKPGVLTIAYPTNKGWIFTPVSSYNGYVTFQTMDLGDPLIAWHFVDMDRVNLEYEIEGESYQYCGYNIPVTISPDKVNWSSTFEIHGQVNPSEEFGRQLGEVGLVIKVYYYPYPRAKKIEGGTYHIKTDEEGRFKIKVNPSNNEFFTFQEGRNVIEVHAECDSPGGKFSSHSRGYGFITIKGDAPTQSTSSESSGTTTSPVLYLDKNLFCRTGPGALYPDVTAFYQGQSFPIIGRASNGWYLVAINVSTTSQKSCWIGGGVPSGDLSQVKYYEVQQPSELNGSVPIYDLYSDKVIGYLSCSNVASHQWWRHPAGWMSNTSLFGSDNALFYPYDSKYICGWEGGTPPGH